MTISKAPLDPRMDLTGKVLPRRLPARDRALLVMYVSKNEAQDLRTLTESITLKGDRKATLSTIARRALAVYARVYASNPAGEVAALDAIVTKVPQPATFSKKPLQKCQPFTPTQCSTQCSPL